MKISLTYPKYEKREIDVQFPIYRKHVFDSSTSYTKITEDLRAITVDVFEDKRKVEVEVEDRYNFGWSDPSYHLGEGQYRSSEREFQDALSQAIDLIDSIRTGD